MMRRAHRIVFLLALLIGGVGMNYVEAANVTLTVTASPAAGGQVRIANGSWTTSTNGTTSRSVAQSTLMSISAQAASGYTFSQWNDGNKNATRAVQITKNTTYTATFIPNTVTLTVTSNNTNYGTVTGGGTYNYGTSVTIKATPKTGYHFVQWSDGNKNASRTVTATANASYTATFAINQYTIKFVNNGTTLQTLTVNHGVKPSYTGSTPTKTATAQYTYTFSGWSPTIVAATADATYTAQFSSTVRSYTIRFLNGSSVLQSSSVKYGTTPSYTGTTPTKSATVQYIYTFSGWSPAIYAVDKAQDYTAQFSSTVRSYKITGASANTNMGTVSGTATKQYGQTVTLTATPKDCYKFVQWNDGNTSNPRTVTVQGTATYTATFEENIYTGTCGATGNEANVQWSLNMCTGTLSITGTGAMKDYGSNSTPWDSYRASINSITIAYGVTHIGSSSFHYCAATSVTIPSSVITIGDFAFFRCASLTSINIPSSVTTINFSAFMGCTSLTSVTIPNSVTGLGMDVFHECTSLTSATLSNSITTIPGGLFEGCSALTSVKIPNGVTSIEGYAFAECSSLPSVTIPNSVTMLGYRVLYKCTSLKDIYVSWTTPDAIPEFPSYIPTGSAIRLHIPCGTKSIYQAPSGWKSYTHVEEIGAGTCGTNLTWFLDCDSVLTISGTGAMADWSAEADVPWYDYRESITSVVLPYGLTHVGDYAFRKTRITKIDLPSALQTIGKYAFSATLLLEVCIPEGVTSIGEKAFISGSEYYYLSDAYAAPLRRVYLPSTLTELGNASIALAHLEYLTYPKSITTLGHTYYHQSKYPAKELYASWTTNIPSRYGPIATVTEPKQKMHIPYGTTAAYRAKDWARVHDLVEDVDERAIDLGLSIRWASCNIGATAPEENGDFYAWGDTLTRSSFTWGTYPYSGTTTNTMTKYCTRAANGTVDNRSTLIAFDDAAYINWGETWRMPTWTEWNELITQCTWKDTTYNDVPVWQVTGPNGNSIYLPKVGYKNNSSITAGCYYWSSTLNTTNSNDQCNRALYINAANRSSAMYGLRYVGMPVRAVYRREWPSFTLTITDTPDGTTYTKAVNAGSSYTLTAQEDACRPFVRWSDGNTENPRTVTVTEDASYTAEYETRHGTCGATGNEANVTWTLCDSTLTISGTGAMADYTSTNNLPWVTHRDAIKTIIVEEGITAIGDRAFGYSTNATSVSLPSSVTSIGDYAFISCSSLQEIIIPNTIDALGTHMLYACGSLTDIYVSWTSSIPEWPTNFTNKSPQSDITLHVPCGTGDVYAAQDGWKDYTIVANLPRVLSGTCGATGNEANVTWSLDLCDSVLTISGTGAMADYETMSSMPWKAYTSGIKTVVVENGVTHIGTRAFGFCNNMTSVSIPATVSSIGGYAFYECEKLTSVTIPSGVSVIDEYTFFGCSALTSVTIPNTVTAIGRSAFYHCGFSSIHIPNSVASIGAYAFLGCDNLTSVIIPNSVTTMGSSVFQHCDNLTSATIPSSVTTSLNRTFSSCPLLTDIYVGWTTAGAIPNWSTMTNNNPQSDVRLHVPCGTTAIYQAKSGWQDYTIVNGPYRGTCGAEGDNLIWELSCDGTLTINGTGAMVHWYDINAVPWYSLRGSIQRVVIEEGVTSIGHHAFYNNGNITSVSLPSTLTSIGVLIFANCSSLTDVYASWTDNVPAMPDNIHNNPASQIKLHIPCGTTDEYTDKSWNTKFTLSDGVISGTCGAAGHEDEVTWSLDLCDSTLTISGTGAMADWNFAPWSSNQLAIKTVVINSGVTNIGNNAFANCENLQSVTIPESVTTIGVYAFYRCFKLQSITIPQSVISLKIYALNDCDALKDIYVSWSENITPYPQYPFNLTNKYPQSSITLHVPCDAIELYQAATGWKDYTIEGEGSYTITVTTDDASMGSVSITEN